jgi:prophage regulatory protein
METTGLGLALLRRRQVEGLSGLSRSVLYNRISLGLWTPPVKLGPRAVAWPASEVEAINGARVAGQGDEQIRKLVARLVAARRSGAALLLQAQA